MNSIRLTDDAIEAIGAAVFAKPGAAVLEAYSEFDQEPRQFHSAESLVEFIKLKLSVPRGTAFFFVIYPDMGGRAVKKTIHLDSAKVAGHALRYTWEGWGLIWVNLQNGDGPNRVSRISANSEKRAEKWAPTYPELEPPATWNWKAVASHERRLHRVLRKSVGTRSTGSPD